MSQRGQFVVNVHDLDAEGRRITMPITVEWLRGALEGCEIQPGAGPGQLDVVVSKLGEQVLVRGGFAVALQAPCARCLEPVQFSPDVPLSLLFQPAPPAASDESAKGRHHGRAHRTDPRRNPARDSAPGDDDETELAAADADSEVYQGDDVVLDPYLREAVLLESPNFPLCSEACSGIAPARDSVGAASGNGSVANTLDPRLAPLLKLVKKEAPKE